MANSDSNKTMDELLKFKEEGEKRLRDILVECDNNENEGATDIASLTKYLDEYSNIDSTLDALDACLGALDKRADALSNDIKEFLNEDSPPADVAESHSKKHSTENPQQP